MAMPAVNALDHQLRDTRRLAEQRAHEPSMEEILASIRRIIADDDMIPLTPRAPEGRPAPVSIIAPAPLREARPAEPVLRMPEPVAARPEPVLAPQFVPAPEPLALEPEPAPFAAAEPAAEPIRAYAPPPVFAPAPVSNLFAPEPEPILSHNTDASVSTSFQALASSIFMQNTPMIEESLREMLRPMLKNWLDDNLPTLVEKLVRTEIERVARGGR